MTARLQSRAKRQKPGFKRPHGPLGTLSAMNRVHQAVLIFSTLLGSWLGMQDVHELGHVVAAWLTGGRVAKVVLDPLTISRTDLAENPRPLAVVWGGPTLGVAMPLAVWLAARGDDERPRIFGQIGSRNAERI